jgi:hypothetical protein
LIGVAGGYADLYVGIDPGFPAGPLGRLADALW